MKKLILGLAGVLLLFSGVVSAEAKDAQKFDYNLGHDVTAETIVTDPNGPVTINFFNKEGKLGTINLTPEKQSAKNLRYSMDKQKLIIKEIELGNIESDTSIGTISINMRVTDQRGLNGHRYVGKISKWQKF